MKLQPWEIDALTSLSISKMAKLEDSLWTELIDYLYSQSLENKLEDSNYQQWKQQMLNTQGYFGQKIDKMIIDILDKVIYDFKDMLQDQGVINLTAEEEWLRRQFNSHRLAKKPNTDLKDSQAVKSSIRRHLEQDPKYLSLAKTNLKKNSMSTMRKIVHDSISEYEKGGKSTGQAIYAASRKMAENGVPMLIDKAGKHWDPEVYTKLVMTNTITNVENEAQLARFQEYGGKLVRVSSHAGCRPTHLAYQDNIYCFKGTDDNYPNLKAETNYGTAGGLCGINCRHYLMPYVPDAGEFQPVKQVDEAENNRRYKLVEHQRFLERRVRSAKRDQYAAAKLGDEAEFNKSSQRVRRRQSDIRQYTSANNLTRQYQREQYHHKQ